MTDLSVTGRLDERERGGRLCRQERRQRQAAQGEAADAEEVAPAEPAVGVEDGQHRMPPGMRVKVGNDYGEDTPARGGRQSEDVRSAGAIRRRLRESHAGGIATRRHRPVDGLGLNLGPVIRIGRLTASYAARARRVRPPSVRGSYSCSLPSISTQAESSRR